MSFEISRYLLIIDYLLDISSVIASDMTITPSAKNTILDKKSYSSAIKTLFLWNSEIICVPLQSEMYLMYG